MLAVNCIEPVFADEIVGRMSASYGYALNDMIWEYGVIKSDNPQQEFFDTDGGEISPGGIVYADIINFDANDNPYLVVFTMNSDTHSGEVHVWKYNEQTKKAEKIAKLSKSYSDIPHSRMGEFNLGSNNEKRYVSYKEYENNVLVSEEYYTVINGDMFMYVNKPKNVYDWGIMNFNNVYFHPNVSVTDYNKPLDMFFSKMKDAAADSVTLDDMAEHLEPSDEDRLENVLSKAVNYTSFDILNCKTIEDYKSQLDKKNCTDRFYLITNVYNLGDELYYVRFSTDRSFYNYTLLRRTDALSEGYQILKVNADCIPLSDSELAQIKDEYSRCPLLYKKASGKIKVKRNLEDIGIKLPKLNIEKRFNDGIKLPAALLGGGIGLALITALWFVLTIGDDE